MRITPPPPLPVDPNKTNVKIVARFTFVFVLIKDKGGAQMYSIGYRTTFWVQAISKDNNKVFFSNS
jgi:hypothetical protein